MLTNTFSWNAVTVANLHDEFRQSGAWGRSSISERFAEVCYGAAAESRFIVVSGQRPSDITFRELREAALRVASGFRRLGIGGGTRVAMLLPNWLEACLTFQACCALGAPLVPILHLYSQAEVLQIINRSKARFLVLPSSWMGLDYGATLAAVLERAETVEGVILVDGDGHDGHARIVPFERLLHSPPLAEKDCHRDPDSPALVSFTSGVSGSPKAVVHSQNSMMAAINATVAAFGGADHVAEVGLNPNPVGHGTGLFVSFVLPFLHSFRSVLLLDRWDPQEMLSLMEEHRVTVVGGPPVFLNAMLRSSRVSDTDTSALRAVILGGDVIPPAVVEDAERVGWTALRAYGLTEHPSVSMGSPFDALADRATTDGRVVPGTDVRIVGPDGQDLPLGETGEILVRGPGQCIGILEGANLLPATETGWLRTGDLGQLDGGRRLTVRGRVKDIIIRAGEKISCSEVESVLLKHPDVADVAVVGLPHGLMGQQVAAFIVVRAGARPDLKSVARHCLDSGLAKHKVPKRLRIINTVPRSLLGKVQRYRLSSSISSDAQRGL